MAAFKYGPSVANEALYSATAGLSTTDNSPAELSNVLRLPEFIQSGPSYQSAGGASVPAAIQTKRTVEVKPVNIPQESVEPHIVDVEATYQPVHVVFRSSSSPVMVQQIHTPAQPSSVEPTQSEDEPHRVQHQVLRPVIQEVREIIQPYRRVLQEVRPVLEEVRTVVAKAEGRAVATGSYSAGGIDGGGALNGGANSGVLTGSTASGAGSYVSAAASVPTASYSTSKARRSSAIARGAILRKSLQRRAVVGKHRQQNHLYTSSA